LNILNDFKNLVLHPVGFYDDLASREERSFAVPLIAVFILSVISAIIVKSLYMEYYAEISQGIDTVFDGDLSKEIQIQGLISIVVAGLAPLVVIFVKSYMVNGIASFGGFGNFKDSLTAISYAYLPAAAGTFIASLAAVLLDHYGFNFSPGSILEFGNNITIATVLLKEFDIFVIWYEILAIIGISKIYRVNYNRSSFFILGTWFSWILISVGFVLMTI
jgi:hypothetical protein